MIIHYYKKIIQLTFLLTLPLFANAQTSDESVVQPREFQEAQWQRAKEGIDYSADVLKTRKKKKNDEKKGKGSKQSPAIFEGGNAASIMKVLIIALAAVALIFLIISLLNLRNPRNKKIKAPLSATKLAEIEENIHEADLEDYIRQAIEQQDFALAIRLYYLAILKELSLKKLIHWKKDKTNKDYLREMRPSPLSGAFGEITAIFERIWYGESPVQALEFQRLEPKFRALAHQINAITTLTAK